MMLEVEKEAVLKVINSLWAHDAWNWGNTCASLINHEIDFDKPAIVEIDGEYITANVYVKDGREFQIGYQEGGWWMCFIKDCEDPRARLTLCKTCQDDDFCVGDYCPECGKHHTGR